MADDSEWTADDAVELEAMRKEDSSWHPCRVSVCPKGVGLIIDYGNSELEDIIMNKEEALARLRIRSLPLQVDDCSHIKEGDHVLAARKLQSRSLFFDAEIAKILRVRHSKKVHCRCTFEVKWLHQDLKGGTLIVPSSSIMKLATKVVNVHPIIYTFLNLGKISSCSDVSPPLTVAKDMDCQIDIHDLLEKQIEEISNSVDASKNKVSQDLLFGVPVVNQGLIQGRKIAVSKVSKLDIQGPADQNPVKRFTRSQHKLQMEMKVKDPPVHAPSTQESPESKSPINPLAARAALASLMSKLSQNLDISICEEREESAYSDFTSQKHVMVESLDGTGSCKFSFMNDQSMTDKLSLQVETASLTLVPKCKNIINGDVEREIWDEDMKLRSSNNTRGLTSPSFNEEEDQSKAKNFIAKNISAKHIKLDTSDQNIRVQECHILENREMIALPLGTEINLPPAKEKKGLKEIEGRNKKHNIEKLNCTEERKNYNGSRRHTRSAVLMESRNKTMNTVQEVEEEKFSARLNSDFSEGNVTVPESNEPETKKQNCSPLDAEIKLPLTEGRNNRRKRPSADKALQKAADANSSSNKSNPGLKRKSTSLTKHQLRFSPRLKFLSQTHSQDKS